MVELSPLDRGLLDGDFGRAASRAMHLLSRYADALGADRFISIESAHIDGCLYHGPSSIDFVRSFLELGGRVRVSTTLNVAAVDLTHPERYPAQSGLVDAQAQLIELHRALGCEATLTCAPYQRKKRPAFGEHVAWAESNAIVFVNSVLGARSDRYGDFTDLCAALTGRVPYAGLHRDENRRATVAIAVCPPVASRLPRDLYFACLGYALGVVAGTRVAALTGLAADATEDELKALGTAAAVSGSVGMFHMVGVTPEAPTLISAAGGNLRSVEQCEISATDLHAVLAQLCKLEVGQPVAAVCLGTPHYSLEEFATLTRQLQGRKRHPDVEFYVSTSREIAKIVHEDPAFAPLAAFGVQLVVDTCTYVTPIVRAEAGSIVTTSAKWAHYAACNPRRASGLMTLERCLRSAEGARVAPS